jgi:hypothetical protein
VSANINIECDGFIASRLAPTLDRALPKTFVSPMKKPAATAGFFSKQEAGA